MKNETQIDRDIAWLDSQMRFYAMGGGADMAGADVTMHKYSSAAQSLRTLLTDGKILREALEWYAKQGDISVHTNDEVERFTRRAREALVSAQDRQEPKDG